MYSFTRLFTATLYHDTVRMYVNLFIFSAVFFALFTPADGSTGWHPIKTGGNLIICRRMQQKASGAKLQRVSKKAALSRFLRQPKGSSCAYRPFCRKPGVDKGPKPLMFKSGSDGMYVRTDESRQAFVPYGFCRPGAPARGKTRKYSKKRHLAAFLITITSLSPRLLRQALPPPQIPPRICRRSWAQPWQAHCSKYPHQE